MFEARLQVAVEADLDSAWTHFCGPPSAIYTWYPVFIKDILGNGSLILHMCEEKQGCHEPFPSSFSFLSFFPRLLQGEMNLEAVTRESNVISIRHQIKTTTESWNGVSIIHCMDFLFWSGAFFPPRKINVANVETASAVANGKRVCSFTTKAF